MAALGDKYFSTVKESKLSKAVACVVYTGPTNKPVNNQDTISTAIVKMLNSIKNHEKRLTNGGL